MGMYNECYKRCKCGKQNSVQIRQIVLGFGEFDLDDPESLADKLTEVQILELAAQVNGERFHCACGESYETCGRDERVELARRLFTPS